MYGGGEGAGHSGRCSGPVQALRGPGQSSASASPAFVGSGTAPSLPVGVRDARGRSEDDLAPAACRGAIFTGYVFPPIGVPLQITATSLLLNALARRPRWTWIALSCIPRVVLVPLYVLNREVSDRLYSARTSASTDPLHSVERESYSKQLKNRRLAWTAFSLCLFATPFATVSTAAELGVLAVTAAAGWFLVSSLMQVHATRKKLARAGIVKVIVAKSPLAESDERLMKRVA